MEILTYKLFFIPIIVMGIAQLMKFGGYTLRNGLDWDYVFTPGHFPSAHSAFVTSLVVTIGYFNGIEGPAFAVACAFAIITIYDAMRVRMHIGIQGSVINDLIDKLDPLDEIDADDFPHMKERVGHYASEVAGGIAVGILATLILIWILQYLTSFI